ncbi:MAG: Uma2 family endonuclease [Cyanobacteria bacterium J06643_4]
MRKWSVDEFEGLVRHRLTDSDVPVELMVGKIVPLPYSDVLVQQVMSLRQQIQQQLDRQGMEGWVVRSHSPIRIDNYSELKPVLTLVSQAAVDEPNIHPNTDPDIHWVLEITDKARDSHPRSALYAKRLVSDYWHLSMQTMELQIYSGLAGATYQTHRLLMVGDQANLTALPTLRLRVQEPLPLYFLTRTARGQRTYASAALPLQIV